MNRLFLLNTIKDSKGGIATSNLGNVLAMKLEVIGVTTESKSVLPSDSRKTISYKS